MGQEILNSDVEGGVSNNLWLFQIQKTFEITSELQLYYTALGALVFVALMLFAGWLH